MPMWYNGDTKHHQPGNPMKKALYVFLDTFFGKELDFRARLFNVLAMAGAVISLAVAVLGPFTGAALANTGTCVFSFVLAVVFLYYANRTGRYRIFYFFTIVVVFVLLFPVMFFSAGGYHSGMPVFFVFAVVFTVFMLDGAAAFVMAVLELLIYAGICLYAFSNPAAVHFFETEEKFLTDVISAFVTVSVALGITMFLHFRIYNEQRRQLEKAREEAIRLSEVKSTFLANMSHEIRTPINVILGMNEMILRESALLPAGGGGDESIATYGSSIETAGKTLLELINNILDISKIESGKTELLDEGYKTADLVRELSMAGSEQAGGKGLRFVLEADERLPRKLYGDFIHLKQIGFNFLSNAAKYTEQGSITLRISGNRKEKASEPDDWKAGVHTPRLASVQFITAEKVVKPVFESGYGPQQYNKFPLKRRYLGACPEVLHSSSDTFLLRIAVEDTGIGIKEEHREILFDAFTRIDVPGRRNIEGTGLGLAIARELAELMGGNITVQSEWGKGSVFTLELPQIIEQEEPMGRDYTVSAGRVPREEHFFTAKGGRVLAVDDNRENLLVLRSLLRRTLLTVDTVSSGIECLEAVKRNNYHVIFMDYMMSGMDGIETFRRLREENKNFALPVIALTADARREMRQRFLEEGFSACLTKPVMWRDLEQCLRQWLPAEFVTGGGLEEPDSLLNNPPDLPQKMEDSLAKDLAAWGVLLEEGRRYLEPETSLWQYKRLAEFFTENFKAARKETLVMADQKNWKGLRFSVHSLKSKARAMGAADLYATAACMEKYCMAGDGTYIETAMPLFLLEWERASQGLDGFIARMNELTGEVEAEPREERTGDPGISRDDDIETLLRCIRGNRWSEATETLNRLLVTVTDEAEKQKFRIIQEKISGLEFEEAERLLQSER